MSSRVDSASRLIFAPAKAIASAFADPRALERWLPPGDMTGEMLHFDFRDGGSYRMRLTYAEPIAQGKTTEDSDEVEVRIVRVEDERKIEQEVTFNSEDPLFSGVMRMIWTFAPRNDGTMVQVQARDVPAGITPADHQAGLASSLQNLASFVEERST